MSEKENKVKDLLEWLEDKNGDVCTLWGLEDVVTNPRQDKTENDKETLLKIFTEDQLRFIKILIADVVSALEFHNKEDDSAHPYLKNQTDNIDAKLRNHRHDTTKQFSAKPEF